MRVWIWLATSACISAGAQTGVGITTSGKPWFEAGGTPLGAEWRSKDLGDATGATLYRLSSVANVAYRPDPGAPGFFGGMVGLEGGVSRFSGRFGLGVNVIAGWRGMGRFSGGENRNAFVVRVELGVDFETSPADWSVVTETDSQSPGATEHCPKKSAHSFLSLKPAIEYAAWKDRPNEVSLVFDVGVRRTWDPCSPFALGP